MNKHNAIITGASEGLGFEIAKAYVKSGINVSICARNKSKIERASDELLKIGKSKVFSKSVDISNENEIEEFVSDSIGFHGSISILVNNAGVYGPKGNFAENDWEEWKQAININLLGNIFMIKSLLPHFKYSGVGKIIQLSGGGATSPLPNLSSYAVAKSGIVRFIETIALELKDFNIQANSIAPGALNTRLLDEILEAGPNIVGSDFYNKSVAQKESGGAAFEHACRLALYLADGMNKEITGRLISAIWDKWDIFNDFKDKISDSDIYTIRRVAGKDRDLNQLDV